MPLFFLCEVLNIRTSLKSSSSAEMTGSGPRRADRMLLLERGWTWRPGRPASSTSRWWLVRWLPRWAASSLSLHEPSSHCQPSTRASVLPLSSCCCHTLMQLPVWCLRLGELKCFLFWFVPCLKVVGYFQFMVWLAASCCTGGMKCTVFTVWRRCMSCRGFNLKALM